MAKNRHMHSFRSRLYVPFAIGLIIRRFLHLHFGVTICLLDYVLDLHS